MGLNVYSTNQRVSGAVPMPSTGTVHTLQLLHVDKSIDSIENVVDTLWGDGTDRV